MKGRTKRPITALCTLLITLIIHGVSTATELNVTVIPNDIRVYPGTGTVVINCFIRNMDTVNQKLHWYHEFEPSSFRVVSDGADTVGQYHNQRFDITVHRSVFTLLDLNYYLTITDFMQNDVGKYNCYVVDKKSNHIVGKDSATVSIFDRPKSPSCSPEGGVSIMEGSLLRLSCSSETESPDNMTLTWIPPKNTVTSWDGPQDVDWQVVDNSTRVAKRLNLVVDNKFNNSKFLCATETDEDNYLVYGHCIIGLITVLSVPPGPMDISVNVRQLEFPLRDGVISGFVCDIAFTPPVSATDYIQRYWQTSPEVEYGRLFQPNNPIQRNIYIDVLAQDSGVVLTCTVTLRDKVYVGNITLHVTLNASIPETTISYPTAATNSVSTRTLPPISNLPWYTEPSIIALLCGAVAVLLLFIILTVCLTYHRRRKLNRNRVQEVPVGFEVDSGYSPIYLNTRPVTVLSENIYNEASDPTADPSATFRENIYHETMDPTSPMSTSDGNIYHEMVDSTDAMRADGENVYHEAAESMVLPSNESQEEFPSSTSDQMPFECGSPVPELELYAETVENILYVPLPQERVLEDGYSSVVETQLR